MQTIIVRDRMLHRMLGRRQVTVETAGGMTGVPGAPQREPIAPIIPEDQVPALLRVLQRLADRVDDVGGLRQHFLLEHGRERDRAVGRGHAPHRRVERLEQLLRDAGADLAAEAGLERHHQQDAAECHDHVGVPHELVGHLVGAVTERAEERLQVEDVDLADLEDPQLIREHMGVEAAIDHNLYIVGDLMYQSNYKSGLRILDISDRENPREVAFFKTFPGDDAGVGFDGSWSNYPYFKSGTIVVSSIGEGLFVLRKRDTTTVF